MKRAERRRYVLSAWLQHRTLARRHERAGRFDAAWANLEAAHVLGQRITRLHVGSHFAMLRLAWRTRDAREIRGQLLRLVAACLVTWIWTPAGNSGRSHVSALTSAPIPRDIMEEMRGSHPVLPGDGE